MGAFIYRLMGASLLDVGAYEGVEHDPRATWQAALAVVLSSLAAGIGASGVYGPSLMTLVSVTLLALVTWIAWAALVYQIGSRWLPEPQTEADLGELLRTVGFAATPGLLQVAAVFPRMTMPVFVISWAWMLTAMVVAVKHALDYRSTARAVGVCLLSLGLVGTMALGLGVVFGRPVS